MRTATLILGLLLPAAPAPPEQDFQVSGAAGWGGRAVRGEFAPVIVDLDNRGKKDADLTLVVAWAASFATQPSESPSFDRLFGRSGPAHQIPVSLPAKSRKRISLSLLTPDSNQISVWAFALDEKGRTVARSELGVRLMESHKRIVAVVGTSRPEGLESPSVELANLSADELPEEWQGYGALEALVWLDGRATEIRSAAQVDALRQWISAGGKFCVARSNTVNLAGTPIAELLPVKLGSTRALDSLGGGRFPDGPAVMLESAVRKGAIRAETAGVPLVVEASRDAGRVTFAGVNPGIAPFEKWAGAATFWTWLLDVGPAPKPSTAYEDRPARAIGSRPLAEQAGRFPDIAAPEIGGLFLLIVLYLVVVGPLDYLLLRWLRKLEYTWFTFPAYVILFTLFILLVGGAFIQRAAHQREIAVVDHYLESGFVRRHALSAVLAPADVLYRVDDAHPLSSNYIQADRGGDQGETTDIRFLRTPQRVAENWLIKRNFTGLALADRCGSGPSPLTYLVAAQEKDQVRLTVKNSGGEAFAGAALVTSRGVYRMESIPSGDSTVQGAREGTIEEFVAREGSAPVEPNEVEIHYRNRYAAGQSEWELNPLARKALIGASFPAAAASADVLPTGMARGLEARRWLDSGGTILLAWPQKADPVVRYEPKPGRLTSVTLYRFFQGPTP